MCPSRAYRLGIGSSKECPYCGAPDGTLAYQWNECSAILKPSDACPEVVPDAVVEFQKSRNKLFDQNFNGAHTFDLSYGMPVEPVRPRLPEEDSEVFLWGDAEGQWGPITYPDASGMHISHPALGRVGWAIVQFCPSIGLPVRAQYGGLPGRDQTVPRGERYAGYRAMLKTARPGTIVSDHLSFVREARRWDSSLEASGSLHAELWRK